MSDLIKRLDRLAGVLNNTTGLSEWCQLIYEVSNELEKLEAENAALKGEVKRYQWLSDRLGEICKANLEAKEMQAAIEAACHAKQRMPVTRDVTVRIYQNNNRIIAAMTDDEGVLRPDEWKLLDEFTRTVTLK